MKNCEKYEKELREYEGCFAVTKQGEIVNCWSFDCEKCLFCKGCAKLKIDWLLEEYKEPILDDKEREYLSAVIKPFKKRITSIQKVYYLGNSAFIVISMNDGEHIFLPYFNLNSGMYQRMEIDKEYTLKELCLC